MRKLISLRNEIVFCINIERTLDFIISVVIQRAATVVSAVASWVDDATIWTKVQGFISLTLTVTGRFLYILLDSHRSLSYNTLLDISQTDFTVHISQPWKPSCLVPLCIHLAFLSNPKWVTGISNKDDSLIPRSSSASAATLFEPSNVVADTVLTHTFCRARSRDFPSPKHRLLRVLLKSWAE